MQKENRGEECKMEVSSASKPDVTFTPLSSKLYENDRKNEKEIGKIPSSYCSGKEESDMKKPPAKDVAPAATVIDDDCLTPKIWLTLHHVCPDDPQSKLTILEATKNNILDKTGWLYDTEINAGQILLKKQFPLVDGLCDPAIKGHLVDPATSEFVQIINVGRHWLCLSTIGVSCPGTVRVFDSLFSKPNAITSEHGCPMLLHTGDAVTFINEKVQKQIGFADCGLFALAFATDLCQGFDPTTQSYDQSLMRQHYVNCLESATMSPFPKTTRRVPYHMVQKKTSVPIFCQCRFPNDKREYVECFKCSSWYHTECVQVPEWAINSKTKWQCQKCKDRRTLRLHNSLV